MKKNAKKYKYPWISKGYISIASEEATLNSSFYALLCNNDVSFDSPILFPQRVLKKDFFDELSFLESANFRKEFNVIRTTLTQRLRNVVADFNVKDSIKLINLANFNLRYGLFENLLLIDTNALKNKLVKSDYLEVCLIKTIANFQLNMGDPNDSITLFQELGDLVLNDLDLTERIRLLTINYLIVTIYRHGLDLEDEKYIKNFYSKLTDILNNYNKNDFGSNLRKSVAFRGLAMVNELGHEIQYEFLNNALLQGQSLEPTSSFENILIKENLYTCLQSLSKWHINSNQFDKAEANLFEMSQLDIFDSTAYGELGFFFLSRNCFVKAAEAFKKAVKLGPPAVGMHNYYYAKCMQNLEKFDEAIEILHKTTKLDPTAISPWLDLIDLNISNGKPIDAKYIANNLLKNSIYTDQLELDEITTLHKLIED
jgi:Tfp pilus assembly protein PilF